MKLSRYDSNKLKEILLELVMIKNRFSIVDDKINKLAKEIKSFQEDAVADKQSTMFSKVDRYFIYENKILNLQDSINIDISGGEIASWNGKTEHRIGITEIIANVEKLNNNLAKKTKNESTKEKCSHCTETLKASKDALARRNAVIDELYAKSSALNPMKEKTNQNNKNNELEFN